MGKKRMLVIDDEPDIAEFLRDVAEGYGFEVSACDNADDFWERYDTFHPDVIFLDLKMPKVDGIEVLRKLATRKAKAGIVIMSGMDQRVLQSSARLGSDHGLNTLGTLGKPITVADIKKVLDKILVSLVPVDEAELSRAIEKREIVVYYQPKINLSNDRAFTVTGCEALARWEHPAQGLLGPDAFISLAENTKLIAPLSELVLRQIVEQLASWQIDGISLPVSFNLSPHLLGMINLPDIYEEICRSKGIETGCITLELTESGVMEDPILATDVMTRFRLKGFGLSLDDFGTGYSSLVQLHRMPFNEMKIDKSFVIDSDRDAEAVKIIRSIAGLANSLDLKLCAEGVESEKALALVQEVGCHTAQGYLIGRPMPAVKLLARFRRKGQSFSTIS